MKVLIVSQRYWPENFRITDIAETLVSFGHEVTVLTGLPNYPEGYIYDGYKHGENRIQEHNGVHIIRVKEIERRHDIFHRFLNYYSFPKYGKKMIKKLDKDFDVILMNELSPIMAAYPAIEYKKRYGTKIVMYEMDLWPESLLAGGIKKNSIIYKHYKKVSSNIYSQMDKILVSTKEHIEYIKALPKGHDLDIEYLPQYAESMFEENIKPREDDGITNFMFAGNIGKAQNLDIVIDAANILKEHKKIKFHIVGDGSEKARLEEKAKSLHLDNVIFYGSKPKEEMPKYYAIADVMLVTLVDSSYANMTVPGKVQSYMAAGKPILSAAKGATNNLIKEANIGLVVESLEPQDFAKTCCFYNKNNVTTFALNSYCFYKSKFDKNAFLFKIESTMKGANKTNN